MVEKNMQVLFKGHLQKHPPEEAEVYELKICKRGEPLAFSRLQENQETALLAVQNEGFYHKITDPPVYQGMTTRFNASRPFDCMYLRQIKAYVVIWWYYERQPKMFVKIPIDDFIRERETSDRKSLTEKRAFEIGEGFLLDSKKQ